MTNTRLCQFAFPLLQKLQLLRFDDIVKLPLAKIMPVTIGEGHQGIL